MNVTDVDGCVTDVRGHLLHANVQVRGGFGSGVTDVTDERLSIADAPAHACTYARLRGTTMETICYTVNLLHPEEDPLAHRIVGGRCVVDGVEHVMRVAKPSSVTARLYGMNPNHHVRVWCTCQADTWRQRVRKGEVKARIPGGGYATSLDPADDVAADPRANWAWDCLGIADVRESGSALRLFRDHIREVANGRPAS